ncbi:xanthine dehydrogenase family protein molybdopterin-binding subunit [Occallatibacter riparius]|uniref:Xanthine dehydrogenase family protein molybdopterin-binding subunit n=1 Tax=Occallatibacter riparius TaxID=1002689 RepID=A0A9J7BLP9_9BACT|nr:xanthine dehydrogenase family protein molybdopterin-binding subunit [Occallatibacter riparius]UWZ83680.1 xanthine dehydrogenase family protein molybdopterin-binding subunit [Occallatibacter riparius]
MATARIPQGADIIGAAVPRIDGPLKTTGVARYSLDHHFPNLVHGVPVQATIGRGRIRSLDASAAEKMPGVLLVMHHGKIGNVYRTFPRQQDGSMAETRPPFEDDKIYYWGQYVAAVIAETLEQAKAAAAAIKIEYDAESPDVRHDLSAGYEGPHDSSWKRGDPDKALSEAPVTIDQTYVTPVETHNPMEMHGTVAVWDGENITLYDSSQGVVSHRTIMSEVLGIPRENVRTVSRFIGSGFGGKLSPWPQCTLAAAAARQLNRPVKISVDRRMMFSNVGHRPRTQQRIRLGATKDGKLTAIRHDFYTQTSQLDDFVEHCGEQTPFLYSCPNLEVTTALTHRNVGTPCPMRGPGAVPGLYALESGINELAWKLNMDPVELRLKNDADHDEGTNKPFSSRHWKECLTTGAEKIGWSKRTPGIGSMRRDGKIIGLGLGSASWSAARIPATASVELCPNGRVCVRSATQDIGTGTYTLFAQVAHAKTGVPLDRIDVFLGDTNLPDGPTSGGSMVTSAILPAATTAVNQAVDRLLHVAALTPGSPFHGSKPDHLTIAQGRVVPKPQEPGQPKVVGASYSASADLTANGVPFEEVLRMANLSSISATGRTFPSFEDPKAKQYSMHSFGAHFAEVEWDPEIVRLRVSRIVSVFDCGKIINMGPAKNQILGAAIMGLGMSLLEETVYDPRTGQPINGSFADYLVATCADLPDLDVTYLDYPDTIVNEYGARGVGEIGMAGVAPAITEAVYHATGVRVRELPIRIEDLLQSKITAV